MFTHLILKESSSVLGEEAVQLFQKIGRLLHGLIIFLLLDLLVLLVVVSGKSFG